MKVAKVYYKVHLGASHRTLANLHGSQVADGTCVVFVNAGMSAAKVLYSGGLLAYLRPASGQVSLDSLVRLAAPAAGAKLSFDGKQVDALARFAASLDIKAGWLSKVVGA